MQKDHFEFKFAVTFTGAMPEWAFNRTGLFRGLITADELLEAWKPAPERVPDEIYRELEDGIKVAAARKVEQSDGRFQEPVIVTADDL